ncbi:MAG: hypothetical protein M1330_01690 [Armatimonadetes bacterium]|nr:hypothetical protein [Armatimonadota bacterium]
MNISVIEQLAACLEKSNLTMVSVENPDGKIVLRRAPSGRPAALPVPIEQPTSEVSVPAPTAEGTKHLITSQYVGFFHHLKPIVGLGALVTAGQAIGMVESTNLQMEIVAEVSGAITDVLIEDGAAVEYGQPLFEITE